MDVVPTCPKARARHSGYMKAIRSSTPQEITYREIPKFCDRVDKNKRSEVLLTRSQANMYKRMTEHDLRPLRGIRYFADMAAYGSLLTRVMLFARNLFLLAYFHRHDSNSINRIQFLDKGSDVLVRFNPDSEPQNFG